MEFLDELEKAVRERGVRVEERVALLRTLGEAVEDGGDPKAAVDELRGRALKRLSRAADALVERARS